MARKKKVVRSVSLGDELILKGVGLVRIIKVESVEQNLYLVKNLKTLKLLTASLNQMTKE